MQLVTKLTHMLAAWTATNSRNPANYRNIFEYKRLLIVLEIWNNMIT